MLANRNRARFMRVPFEEQGLNGITALATPSFSFLAIGFHCFSR